MREPDDKKVLLDTDVFSFLLNGHSLSEPYRKHIEGKRIALSFVTVGELLFGARRRSWGPRRLALLENAIGMTAIVPHDLEICRRYADTKSDLELAGTPIAGNDLWIAACALRDSIPLLSHNRRHFGRVPGIRLVSEGG